MHCNPFLIALTLAAVLGGSSRTLADDASTTTTPTTAMEKDPNLAPDNTGKNVRDRSNQTLTADKQKNSKSDLEITREIRRLITKDDTLSTDAKNVKIITKHGLVTLRGPVASAAEREKNRRARQNLPRRHASR